VRTSERKRKVIMKNWKNTKKLTTTNRLPDRKIKKNEMIRYWNLFFSARADHKGKSKNGETGFQRQVQKRK
jgi:hypothetical protein